MKSKSKILLDLLSNLKHTFKIDFINNTTWAVKLKLQPALKNIIF